MGPREEEFQKKLLATFRIEAEEHVRAMADTLLELEKAPGSPEQAALVERIFREAHGLKGAARVVNAREIETLCQTLEGVFSRAKHGKIGISAGDLDLLHTSMDALVRLIAPPTPMPAAPAPVPTAQTGPAPAAAPPAMTPPVREDTVRVSAGRLDQLLLQTEELLQAKLGAAHRAGELKRLTADVAEWKRESFKARAATLQSAHRTSPADGAQEAVQSFLDGMESRLKTLARAAEHDQRSLGSMVDNLLHDAKELLLLPFSSVTDLFPRLVRDIAREEGKEVDVAVQGADLEVDRRILQEIKEPLIHIVRNCVSHGIERPEVRAGKGKPPRGAVKVAIQQESGARVEVSVSDDGAGVNVAAVTAAAVRLGILPAERAPSLPREDVLSLLFQSGLSTSPSVTTISGRGLGMAIVREKVEGLGGVVTLETEPDTGTTFRLLLPLTLSTFRGLLVRAGERLLVIPLTFVERVAFVRREEIRTVEDRETVLIAGQVVPLVGLDETLGLKAGQSSEAPAARAPVVVLGAARERIAFQVDEVLNEQEVLLKGLGPQLARVPNVSGAAVLGTGKVVPVLNAADLMKSAVRAAEARASGNAEAQPGDSRRKSILVVEDSITARTLMRNILEAAGYEVATAVDGAEAFLKIHEGSFDLVVSDVDMPRMNGFELASRIRADERHSRLPLILVTALESQADRERGMEVGANAYIVKSSFEQSNLLEAVRRFI